MNVTIEDAGIRFDIEVTGEVYEDGLHRLAELRHFELVHPEDFREDQKCEPTPEAVRAFVDRCEGDVLDRAIEEAEESHRRGTDGPDYDDGDEDFSDWDDIA